MPNSSQFVLYYRLEGESWKTFQLSEGEFVLGRLPECNLLLDHGGVSRRHTRLTVEGGKLWLTDLGSTNGTQLENQPLLPRQKQELGLGQTFTVGGYSLYVNKVSERDRVLAPKDQAPAHP
ncbi:MAG: FHA domain-containing protein, partial [Anaerolineales bacterium]|nr:FHA domain-containing protein [Anaerolineales bacterium]